MTEEELIDRLAGLLRDYQGYAKPGSLIDLCVRFDGSHLWYCWEGERFVATSRPRPRLELQ